MKKIFTLLVALTTFAVGLNAAVLFTESFDNKVGDLATKSAVDVSVTNLEWFYTGQASDAKVQVIDTTLVKVGYCSNPTAKSIQLASNTDKVIRGTATTSKDSMLYYSVLLNVRKINSNTTNSGIIVLHSSSSSSIGNCWAQLRYMNDSESGTYKLGVTKTNEDGIRWVEGLPTDSTILVVVRYDVKQGDKNDKCYLWINPTKTSEGKPTTWCVQDTTISGKSGNKGASQKNDAVLSNLSRIQIKPSSQTADVVLDELRIATKWADLFEGGGGDEPELGISPTSITELNIFQGQSNTYTISVTGQKLEGDVLISNINPEVSLSTNKITKATAEGGASLVVTINANTVGANYDTITLVSGSLTEKIPVAWGTISVTSCSNIAAMKTAGATAETFVRLTGEVIVTRDTTNTKEREIYIQDASGAAKIKGTSVLDASNMVGQKIKNFVLMSNEDALGIIPFEPKTKPVVVSTGNEVEPQVVTLATLQANAADYLLEVVQVQKVTFADEGKTFKGDTLYKITQDEQTANVKIEMTRGFAGVTIPGKAHVTGFSMNTSGSAILPRSTDDIVDAKPVLLKNGSFEKYKEGTFMTLPSTEFEDWSFNAMSAVAMAAEKTDVVEGEAAFKTTSEHSQNKAYIYQEIDCENYVTGDQFDVRICYKNLDTKDSAIVLDCYWESSVGSTEYIEQTAEMKQALPNSSKWDSVTFRVTKPEKAKLFVMKMKIKRKALVMLDNLDFKYYEDTVPYFAVLPEKRNYSFTTNINSDTVVAQLTIRQRNLKQPVQLLWSQATDKAIYSVSKSQVTEEEETVEVKFKSSKTGKFNGTLNIMDDESTEASLYNTTISFEATVIDPSVTPEIVVTPMEFDTFRCKALEEVTDTIFVTSSNCSEYVRCWANEQTGPDSLWGFGISDSYLSENETDTVILTFAPKKAGNYTVRLKVFTAGVDTIFINVVGVAEEGTPTPIVVDWDTVFTWKTDAPYQILNEGFDMGKTLRNKTLKVTDWQNVVLNGGDRPWWGFNSDSTQQAKMTSYYSDRTDPQDMETWLVTPALDYKNTPSQVFSFDVMSDLCFEGQTAHLELYYVDPSDPDSIFFQHIEAIDSLIPFGNNELSGNWGTILLPLMNQPFIPDVFFMAFKFYDPNGGKNGATYYVDNVTWGVKEVPSGIEEVHNAQCTMQDVHKFVNNGQLVIVKDGKRYNALGQQIR